MYLVLTESDGLLFEQECETLVQAEAMASDIAEEGEMVRIVQVLQEIAPRAVLPLEKVFGLHCGKDFPFSLGQGRVI